jgi:hypothetical protein
MSASALVMADTIRLACAALTRPAASRPNFIHARLDFGQNGGCQWSEAFVEVFDAHDSPPRCFLLWHQDQANARFA